MFLKQVFRRTLLITLSLRCTVKNTNTLIHKHCPNRATKMEKKKQIFTHTIATIFHIVAILSYKHIRQEKTLTETVRMLNKPPGFINTKYEHTHSFLF